MAKLFILAGIPGSGKSTWARTFLPDLSFHSSDAIRYEMFNGEYNRDHNGVIFKAFHDRIKASLAEGQDVVADSTALSKEARNVLRFIARHAKAESHLVFFQNLEQAVLRNAARKGAYDPTGNNGVVPPDGMLKMLDQYEDAIIDLPSEEYDSITFIGGVA